MEKNTEYIRNSNTATGDPSEVMVGVFNVFFKNESAQNGLKIIFSW